jgi:hypothetical protein
MNLNELISMAPNWTKTCGAPSMLIGTLQWGVVAASVYFGFSTVKKKKEVRWFLLRVVPLSLIPVLAGAVFYQIGLVRVNEALQLVDPVQKESLKKAGELEAMSCFWGSSLYLIWVIVIIMIVAPLKIFLGKKKVIHP